VLYDWDSGRAKDLLHGNVRQAFWSPNDSRVAFLNFQDQKWQVWTFSRGRAGESSGVFIRKMLWRCRAGRARQRWLATEGTCRLDTDS